jgi:hypothetical protein
MRLRIYKEALSDHISIVKESYHDEKLDEDDQDRVREGVSWDLQGGTSTTPNLRKLHSGS